MLTLDILAKIKNTAELNKTLKSLGESFADSFGATLKKSFNESLSTVGALRDIYKLQADVGDRINFESAFGPPSSELLKRQDYLVGQSELYEQILKNVYLIEKHLSEKIKVQEHLINLELDDRRRMLNHVVSALKTEAMWGDHLIGKYNRMKLAVHESFEIWKAKHPLLVSIGGAVFGIVGKALALLGIVGGIGAAWGLIKVAIIDVAKLHNELGKAAAKNALITNESVNTMRETWATAAIELRNTLPFLNLNEVAESFKNLANEGVTDTAKLGPFVKLIEELAYFNGESAKALIPLVAQMAKLGVITGSGSKRQLADLNNGLGAINAGFGTWAGNATEVLIKFSKLNRMDTSAFKKVAVESSALAGALKKLGMTAEESGEFVSSLLVDSVGKMPPMFRHLFQEIKRGNFDGVSSQLENMREQFRAAIDSGVIDQVSASFGMSVEAAKSLAATTGPIGAYVNELKKKASAEKLDEQTAKARANIYAKVSDIWNTFVNQFSAAGNALVIVSEEILEVLGLKGADVSLKAFIESTGKDVVNWIKTIPKILKDWMPLIDFFVGFTKILMGFGVVIIGVIQGALLPFKWALMIINGIIGGIRDGFNYLFGDILKGFELFNLGTDGVIDSLLGIGRTFGFLGVVILGTWKIIDVMFNKFFGLTPKLNVAAAQTGGIFAKMGASMGAGLSSLAGGISAIVGSVGSGLGIALNAMASGFKAIADPRALAGMIVFTGAVIGLAYAIKLVAEAYSLIKGTSIEGSIPSPDGSARNTTQNVPKAVNGQLSNINIPSTLGIKEGANAQEKLLISIEGFLANIANINKEQLKVLYSTADGQDRQLLLNTGRSMGA